MRAHSLTARLTNSHLAVVELLKPHAVHSRKYIKYVCSTSFTLDGQAAVQTSSWHFYIKAGKAKDSDLCQRFAYHFLYDYSTESITHIIHMIEDSAIWEYFTAE